jgi:hypothetical protein
MYRVLSPKGYAAGFYIGSLWHETVVEKVMNMNTRLSHTLASCSQGELYYCNCKDSVTMHFKDRWSTFGPGELAQFRGDLARLLMDKSKLEILVTEVSKEATRRGISQNTLPNVLDLGEMLTLVDSGLLVLDAQKVVANA